MEKKTSLATSKRMLTIAIIVAAVVIPIAVYAASPLFVSTTVNEPSPVLDKGNVSSALGKYEDFMALSEAERFEKGQQMSAEQKQDVMIGAGQSSGTSVNEKMTGEMAGAQASVELSGEFIGVNDGIHNAEGIVKVIKVVGSNPVLRLEEFESTNGPDLYVYLSTDKTASDFVNVGRLKGNIGNQNYEIPDGTDLSRYKTVLIWCKAFSVLFGSAELMPST